MAMSISLSALPQSKVATSVAIPWSAVAQTIRLPLTSGTITRYLVANMNINLHQQGFHP